MLIYVRLVSISIAKTSHQDTYTEDVGTKTDHKEPRSLLEALESYTSAAFPTVNASGNFTEELQVVSVQKFRASRELASRAFSGAFLTAATLAFASARVAIEMRRVEVFIFNVLERGNCSKLGDARRPGFAGWNSTPVIRELGLYSGCPQEEENSSGKVSESLLFHKGHDIYEMSICATFVRDGEELTAFQGSRDLPKAPRLALRMTPSLPTLYEG